MLIPVPPHWTFQDIKHQISNGKDQIFLSQAYMILLQSSSYFH